MKRTVVIMAMVTLAGCANTFQTARFDANTGQPSGTAINGVVYYEPQLVRIRYEFTSLIDKDGKLLGTSENGKCKRAIQKEEIVVQPNYSEPRVLLHKPSMFASGKFGVSLSNGMITAINTESTPILNEFLGQVAKLAEAGVFGVTKGEQDACNSSPVISSVSKQEVPWPR